MQVLFQHRLINLSPKATNEIWYNLRRKQLKRVLVILIPIQPRVNRENGLASTKRPKDYYI